MSQQASREDIPLLAASEFSTSWNDDDILGCGSFAAVRKCVHCDLGNVVVKCFCSVGSKENIAAQLLEVQREANILAKLKHKNIVELYGLTKWGNCMGFVMELVENGNLEDLLMTESVGQIPWSLRIQIMEEMTDGLSYLHSKSVVHGDLKPQNILLTSDHAIKLADFGAAEICKSRSTFNDIPNEHAKQYTPLYSAPEFLKDQTATKTPAMDMYSTGIIAYEVITRHEAFSSTAVPKSLVILKICNSGQKPEERIVDDIEILLEDRETDLKIFITIKDIMKQCWITAPEQRPSASTVNQVLNTKLVEFSPSSSATDIRYLSIQRRRKLQLKRKSSSKISLSQFAYPFFQSENPDDRQSTSESLHHFGECEGDQLRSCSLDKIEHNLRLLLETLQRHIEEKCSKNYLNPDSITNLENIKQEIKMKCKNMTHASTVSDILVSLNGGNVFLRCFEILTQDFMTYPNEKIEQQCFEETREVMRLAASHNSRFCEVLDKNGLLAALGKDLKKLKSCFQSNIDIYGYYLIQAMDIIEKCAENPQTLRKVKELDILDITKWYCKHTHKMKIRGDTSLTFRSISILCHKVGETNSNLLKLNKDVIDYCVQYLSASFQDESHASAVGINSLLVSHRLILLSTNEANSLIMAKHPDFLNILGDTLSSGTLWQKRHCVHLFRNLTKVGANRRILSKNMRIMNALRSMESELPLLQRSVNEVIASLRL